MENNDKALTEKEKDGGMAVKTARPPAVVAGVVAGVVLVALIVGLAVGLTKKAESSSFTWDEVQVPTSLSPTHYDLRIRPVFDDAMGPENFHLNGSVIMHLKVRNATNIVVFHLRHLTLNSDSIIVEENNRQIQIINQEHNAEREYYILTLKKNLALGSSVKVKIVFSGPICGRIRRELSGIYYSSYIDDNGKTRYLIGSQMESTEARKAFPCLDEPKHKATFSIIIERQANLTSMSNGEYLHTDNLGNNWYADHFSTTVRMSTYLLAFVVSDFKCLNSTTSNGKKVYVCARPTAIRQLEYAHSVAARIQDYLEDAFDTPYPLNKTIHLALPDFSAGAMENWGCILYSEGALLYDDTSDSAAIQQYVAVVITHELAHMWFGNLITPSWWADLWLKEGFASFMEYWGVHSIEPDWMMNDQFLTETLHYALQFDSLGISHPIYQPVSSPSEIREIYDSISYGKGACIIRMMYNFLGEEAFKNGIKRYLKKNEYNVVHHADLFESLNEAYREINTKSTLNVTEVMLTWVLQMGYPVVKMSYNNLTGDITLSQKYFRNIEESTEDSVDLPASPYNYTWIVPISIGHYNGRDFTPVVTDKWLRGETDQIKIEPGLPWIVGNPHQFYYYRVNYDDITWKALIGQLLSDHTQISANSRAQLIDDAFNLARAGEIDETVALDLSKYLDKEVDYVPWVTAFRRFGYFRNMFAQSPHLELLKKYMKSRLRNVYKKVGWGLSDAEDAHLNKLSRVGILRIACDCGLPDCLRDAVLTFRLLRNKATTSRVDPEVRDLAYCYGLKEGDHKDWEEVLQMYNNSVVVSEKEMLKFALSCVDRKNVLARFQNITLKGKEIFKNYASVIFKANDTKHEQPIAWDVVRNNWKTVYSRSPISKIVTTVAQSFATEKKYEELETFIKENAGSPDSTEKALAQAAESTKANIEWKSKSEEKIVNWLKKQLASQPAA